MKKNSILLKKLLKFRCSCCVLEHECNAEGRWRVVELAGGGAIQWKGN